MVTSKIEASFDDGSAYDFKAVRLSLEYNIPTTLFIHNFCELRKEQIKEFSDLGINIGGHTVTHPEDLKRLDRKQLEFEIRENKKWLEDIIGKEVVDFCYPSGRFNDLVIDVLKQEGYKTARQTGWGNTKKPVDNYRIIPSAFVHYDNKKFGRFWFDYAIEQLKRGEHFHIWGHSFEIEKFEYWDKLEKLYKHINTL